MKKSVIITGACGGIGSAIALEFKKNDFFVLATDIKEIPTDGLVYDEFICVDLEKTVNDNQYEKETFNRIQSIIPKNSLSVLVNNAAVQILGGLNTLDISQFKKTLDVNLLAPFIWMKNLVNELEMNNGSIINISSIHAKLTKKDFVAYATSKAALSGMTRALAVDVGHRVRVNAIEPAAVETEMLKAGFDGNLDGYEKLKQVHPVGRVAKACEVAKLAVLLANDEISFTNGSCIELSGGIACKLHDPD